MRALDVKYKDNMEDVLAARFEQLSDAKLQQQVKEVQKHVLTVKQSRHTFTS